MIPPAQHTQAPQYVLEKDPQSTDNSTCIIRFIVGDWGGGGGAFWERACRMGRGQTGSPLESRLDGLTCSTCTTHTCSLATCHVCALQAGPPYEDIAFRVVNKEWNYARKHGFRCSFERGILHLFFNFKRTRYRR